jgi:uncharacterized membrane protein
MQIPQLERYGFDPGDDKDWTRLSPAILITLATIFGVIGLHKLIPRLVFMSFMTFIVAIFMTAFVAWFGMVPSSLEVCSDVDWL